jgi:diaminopimelate decarboxylase
VANKALEYNPQGELSLYGQSLCDLVEEPSYIYSATGLRQRVEQFLAALAPLKNEFMVHYAMKANSHPKILKSFMGYGLGVDVVSGGELKKALDCGFEPQKIIFSGVGKTKSEIQFALEMKIKQINVESLPELERIASFQKDVSIVLRLNPNVDAKTHPYISTGFKENKFGIDETQIPQFLETIRKNPCLKLAGISSHIGSQIFDLNVIQEAIAKMRNLFQQIKDQGFDLKVFDVGGGVGIDYNQDAQSDFENMNRYGQILIKGLSDLPVQIQMEPGRILVARSAALLTQVQYIKRTPHKTFIICDSGMNHLLRPALYQAEHRIFPLRQKAGEKMVCDVVGPVCESSDFLGKNREFTGIEQGDWLAIADTGAYGASMMSDYNAFPQAQQKFI